MPLPRRLLICLLVVSASLRGQSTDIAVNATASVRTIDERIFGINATMWDKYASSDQTIALLKAAGVRTIRLPGGSLSNEYHWQLNRTLDNTWTWATGFNGFARIITALDAHAFVSVNYGTGTPEEAAAWVAYANAAITASGQAVNVTLGVDAKGRDWKTATYWADLRASVPLPQDDGMNFLRIGRTEPVGVDNWEIGNENYGSWETDDRTGDEKYDAYTYAVRAKDYIAKMKAVDPTIKIGVVVLADDTEYDNGHTKHPATNLRTGAVRYGWTPVLLATLKSIGVTPDALVFHRYEQAPASDRPNDPENDARLLQIASTWSEDATSLRQLAKDYLGDTEAAKVELAITENNSVYANPGKQTTSLVNALYYADSIGHLMQTEINALTWWALRNGHVDANNSSSLYGWRDYGDYGILSTPPDDQEAGYYEAYPTYYAFKQVANFARGGDSVLFTTSGNSLLTAFASRRTDGRLSVLVINKDPANAITGRIVFTGFTPQSLAALHVYGKPQDDAARTGTGSPDIASYDINVADRSFTASFPSYSLTVVTFDPSSAAVTAFAQSSTSAVSAGSSATFSATAAATGTPTYQWQRNGSALSGKTGSALSLANVQPIDTGLYTAEATAGATSSTSQPVPLGVSSSSKVIGDGYELTPNVLHPNGKTFDQVLLTGPAEAITADKAFNQVTRTSFIDLTDDIVQVEFSGSGTLSLVLDDPHDPAPPVNYNQDNISYMKGHVGIVITGADESTNVSVFTVGRATAHDPTNAFKFLEAISPTNDPANNGSSLFVGHKDTKYDGLADLSFIAIASTNGKFGGVRASNASFFAHKGVTGLYAPGIQFMGPVFIGNISAFDTATPMIVIGSTADARITGGDLRQANGQPVQVGGLTHLSFTDGSDSHGHLLPAKTNAAVLQRNGVDVTADLVAP